MFEQRREPADDREPESHQGIEHARRDPVEDLAEEEAQKLPRSLQAAYSFGSGVSPVATMSAKSSSCFIADLGLQQVRRGYGYLLSGGERRRVEVARSLVISPSFMLLDEPFSGIDPLAVEDIQRIILQLKSAGIGVLLTDHNVRETLQVTDRAYIVSKGRVFRAGTPEELGNDAEVKKIYLGDNFRLAI